MFAAEADPKERTLVSSLASQERMATEQGAHVFLQEVRRDLTMR
jgi:hypothetical protein